LAVLLKESANIGFGRIKREITYIKLQLRIQSECLGAETIDVSPKASHAEPAPRVTLRSDSPQG
jgi:hypothetical protein